MTRTANRTTAAFAALAAILAGPALAQQAPPERIAPDAAAKATDHAMPMTPGASPSTAAFRAADKRMMREMNHPMTGDTDQDFVAEMLPHHQGAVAMAKVELQYGHDPEMRRLAQTIVAAQEKEIGQMREWQRTHPLPR